MTCNKETVTVKSGKDVTKVYLYLVKKQKNKNKTLCAPHPK